jgi:molybdate transport system ATP-binding protein
MPPNSPIVRLREVDVEIDGICVLRDICLEIAAGERWGIVGANGGGKSTLLALIAGKRWPAPGRGSRIYDFGDGPEHDAVTARERVTLVGHELQDLYVARRWNFRARDVVLSGFTRTDIPRRNPGPALLAAASGLLDRLGLGHLAERRLLELSRGEQRRVLIARALATDPAVLLLDEPASGLDVGARDDLEATLRALPSSLAVVVAAHGTADLPRGTTRLVRIANGRLERLADPDPEPEPELVLGNPPAPEHPARGAMAHVDGDRRTSRTAAADDASGDVLMALEHVSVWIAGRRILADVDWEFRQGEHWLVTGANGAGKSTLLRLLHAEIRPAVGGAMRWPALGDPADVWSLRRLVALVSPELQARYLYPTTVFDAIASGLHASIGLTRAIAPSERDCVEALLAAFELDTLKTRMLRQLSYGQRHRALIARTLVAGPRVLLLDEPWEGLDSASTAIVQRELSARIAAGTQVICVSHVGARGLPLNRALRIEGGRLIRADGSGERPENSASARSPESGSRRH